MKTDNLSKSEVMKKNIVIVGAGPAGLTAAFEFVKQVPDQFSVTVLESSDMVGGISKTVRYEGNRMDLGGHRFFSKDQKVMKWWNDLLPLQGNPSKDDLLTETEKPLKPEGPDPEKVDTVMLYRDRVSRIYYLRHFFDYPITIKWSLFSNMGFVNTIKSGFSYLHAMIHKRPETSLENFYINRFGKKLYSMFFENYTEKVWGRSPSNISADWGTQRVKGLSVFTILGDMFSKMLPKFLQKNRKVETSLIEQFWYPKFGPGQMWEKAAQQVQAMGGKILFRHEVKTVQIRDGHVVSVGCVTPEGNETIPADIIISSMPIRDLINGIDGTVPENVKRIANGLPYRDFITVGLQVKQLELKNETKIKTPYDRIPDCWIYMQEPELRMGRIQIFNNWSPYLVNDYQNSVSLGLEYFCNEGDSFWNMPDENFIQMAIKELVSAGFIRSENVTASHIEHVKKAYPAYFDTYNEIDIVIKWLNSVDNLYCIGRNGQHRYNNMDHSMVTAFEAVKAIVSGTKDKDAVWNVNTEKSYHEAKTQKDFRGNQ